MPATEKVSFTLTPEAIDDLVALTRLWGFNESNPMPKSRVVVEALHRCRVDAESLLQPARKNGKKKS